MRHLNLYKKFSNNHNFDDHLIDNNNGLAPLHYSVQNGNYELVKFFIEKGSDILAKTKKWNKLSSHCKLQSTNYKLHVD